MSLLVGRLTVLNRHVTCTQHRSERGGWHFWHITERVCSLGTWQGIQESVHTYLFQHGVHDFADLAAVRLRPPCTTRLLCLIVVSANANTEVKPAGDKHLIFVLSHGQLLCWRDHGFTY